ncbi:MAG: fumarate hydratase [Candidatus Omnitrophota bacterium]|jgi:fumarate hydratase subunit alpha
MIRREVDVKNIKQAVRDLSLEANMILRPDVLKGLEELYREEKEGTLAKKMLKVLIENAQIARKENLAICQDTGMVVVFLEIGKEVDLRGGDVIKAVDQGVAEAYEEGALRNSVVGDPLIRRNARKNTPAIVHIDLVDGDKVSISVMPKGFGSENKSRLAMMNPTAEQEEILDFCVETVKIAGPDACPPYVLGVGIGGTMDMCAVLAKKALLRPIDKPHKERHVAELEARIKEKVNELGIGVMGLGGSSTVMGVNIEIAPTHIAGLPVAVNLVCHALRSASTVI